MHSLDPCHQLGPCLHPIKNPQSLLTSKYQHGVKSVTKHRRRKAHLQRASPHRQSRGIIRQPGSGAHLTLKCGMWNAIPAEACRQNFCVKSLGNYNVKKKKNEPSTHGKLVIQRIDHLGNWLLANWFGVSRPHSWKAIQQSTECAGLDGHSREVGLSCSLPGKTSGLGQQEHKPGNLGSLERALRPLEGSCPPQSALRVLQCNFRSLNQSLCWGLHSRKHVKKAEARKWETMLLPSYK